MIGFCSGRLKLNKRVCLTQRLFPLLQD